MNWLRLFIPSWRFFDQIGTISKLYYRVNLGDGYMPWRICLEKPKRHVFNLLLNPNGNFYLPCLALVDRLVSEEVTSNIQNTISYRLVENLVRHTILDQNLKAKSFQFKVQIASENQVEDFLISEEVKL